MQLKNDNINISSDHYVNDSIKENEKSNNDHGKSSEKDGKNDEEKKNHPQFSNILKA